MDMSLPFQSFLRSNEVSENLKHCVFCNYLRNHKIISGRCSTGVLLNATREIQEINEGSSLSSAE
jgi:hypothetical protein